MTNEERTDAASKAVETHVLACNTSLCRSDQEHLVDLLTDLRYLAWAAHEKFGNVNFVGLLIDLRHWAKHRDIDFDDAFIAAEDRFEAEINPPAETEVRIFRETDRENREYIDSGDDDIDNLLQQLIDDTIVQTRLDNITRRVGFEIR